MGKRRRTDVWKLGSGRFRKTNLVYASFRKESGVRDGNEDDDEEETKEKYGQFKNAAAKKVWAVYSAIVKGEKREGGDGEKNGF